MTIPVFTASWRVAIDAEPDVQPVRISLGKPKWISAQRAEAYPAIESLMPHGMLHLDGDEFERRYRQLLYLRAPQIEWAMTNLLDHAGRPLLLSCFELTPPCHRFLAASFLHARLGLDVPEWSPAGAAAQMTLTDDEEVR